VTDDLERRCLRQRVEELENRIEQLRLSRRVLMNLVEKTQREKACFVARLEQENRRLFLNNCRYARCLIRKNRKIIALEARLQSMDFPGAAKAMAYGDSSGAGERRGVE